MSSWLPYRVGRTNVNHWDYICTKIEDKFMYWKSQIWPFHDKLKAIQLIMIMMVSYYLPLFPWLLKVIDMVSMAMWCMLWKGKEKVGIPWLVWDRIHTPTWLGGITLLKLHEHAVTQRHYLFIVFFFFQKRNTTSIS